MPCLLCAGSNDVPACTKLPAICALCASCCDSVAAELLGRHQAGAAGYYQHEHRYLLPSCCSSIIPSGNPNSKSTTRLVLVTTSPLYPL